MPRHAATKNYGTVSVERQKTMSGLEFVHGLAAWPSEIHLNPAGTVHGGLAATMLDSCMGLAIHTMLDKGLGSTTLEFKISLLRPITPETGLIKAEGVVLSAGRRVGTAEGRITDGDGRLLAHGTTTCLIFEN